MHVCMGVCVHVCLWTRGWVCGCGCHDGDCGKSVMKENFRRLNRVHLILVRSGVSV